MGLDIFHMAILPVLLNNLATWVMMDKVTINKLENFQHILQRCLLGVPNSTPLVAMSWDLGMISMEHRINEYKLIFLHYLIEQKDEILSKEFFNIQKSLNFPGFVFEARNLIELYGLPNIIDGTRMSQQATLKKEFKMTTSQLKDGPLLKEKFEKKEYLVSLNLSDARTNFRLRSNATYVKMIRKSDPTYSAQLWKCDGCGNLDTQCHIMRCPVFAPLREGLDIGNDKDVVHYFQQVFKLRENAKDE